MIPSPPRPLTLLCGSGPSRSGTELLAGRLAMCHEGEAVVLADLDPAGHALAETPVLRAPIERHLHRLEHERGRGDFLVAVGLPAESSDAQGVVDELIARQPLAALLWERAGVPLADLGRDLDRLERLTQVLTLAEAHAGLISSVVPSARVSRLPAALPPESFAPTGRPAVDEPFAAFFGRTGSSKGGGNLAAQWVGRVFPRVSLPLRMFVVDQEAATGWRVPSGAVTVSRIADGPARTATMRAATIVVFPGLHDHLPQALLESMAAGALVVATSIDGHSLVRDGLTGVRVPITLEGLEHVVEAILDAPGRFDGMRYEARSLCLSLHGQDAARAFLRRLTAPSA